MFGWVSNLFAKRRKRSESAHNAETLNRFRQFMRARVDAAQTTTHNANHWAMADSLSADAAFSLAVRKKVRERARYETLNNPRGRGIIQTYTTAIVGSGPRLQAVTDDEELNEAIETKWKLWARRVGLNDTLRTLRQAQTVDGEAFAVLVTGDNFSELTLDVRQIEADQCSDPNSAGQPSNMDGVEFNPATGKPWRYTFLKNHPGNTFGRFTLDTQKVWASNVIHLYRADRPGQHRGLSEIASALDLFAILRRYTHATLTSAEAAAAFALFMKTNTAIAPAEWDPWDEVEYRHGAAITLPEGWEPFQLKSEHPAAAYDMFVQTIVREIARCLDMPYNVAACDSAGYNYSSGRLDHQIFGRRIQVEQAQLESQCLDKIFSAWLQEATLAGVLPVKAILADLSHTWAWDPLVDIDPQKTVATNVMALQFGLTSYPTVYAEQGLDYRTEMRKQAKALGMSFAAYQAALRTKLLGVTGAPVDPATASEVEASKPTAAGEYSDMSRLQWNRNMKAIRDVVEEIELGTMGEVMALEMLQSLKLPPERAQRLIDDAKTNRHRNPAVGGLAV